MIRTNLRLDSDAPKAARQARVSFRRRRTLYPILIFTLMTLLMVAPSACTKKETSTNLPRADKGIDVSKPTVSIDVMANAKISSEVHMYKPIFLDGISGFLSNQLAIEASEYDSNRIGEILQVISLQSKNKYTKTHSTPYEIKAFKKEAIPVSELQDDPAIPPVVKNISGYIIEPVNSPHAFGHGNYVISGVGKLVEVEEIEANPSLIPNEDLSFLQSKFKYPLKTGSLGSLIGSEYYNKPLTMIEYNNADYYIINIVCMPEGGIGDYGYWKACSKMDAREAGSFFYNRRQQKLLRVTSNYILQNIRLITNAETIIIFGDVHTCKSCGFSVAYLISNGTAVKIYETREEGT